MATREELIKKKDRLAWEFDCAMNMRHEEKAEKLLQEIKLLEKELKAGAVKAVKKKDHAGKTYEQRIPKSVIVSKQYKSVFKSPRTVYDFLWANIVRGNMNNDKLNIKGDYYDHGKLACSFPLRIIAENCFMNIHTAERYIEILKESGFIKVDSLKIDDHRTQNVYILGWWRDDAGSIEEHLFLQDVCKN
jgi:hypothetical protein